MITRPLAAGNAFATLVLALAACSHTSDERRPEPSADATGNASAASADPAAQRAALGAALDELARALASGDGAAAAARLAPGFRGTWLAETAHGEPLALPLGTIGKREDVSGAAARDASGFVEVFGARFAGWRSLDALRWSLESALLESDGARAIATGTLRIDAVGRGTAGAWTGLEALAAFSAVEDGGAWKLSRFDLAELGTSQRPEPLFVDVAAAVGLADAAADATAVAIGDVDRDGLWDLFVAGSGGNRLWVARSRGAYDEVAAERGVSGPAGAATAVLFDADGDTDPDLLLGAPDGLRLLVNDGKGAFTERADAFGAAGKRVAATVAVFDWDLDGQADVFVGCVEPPGELLLRNVDGRGFEDVTQAAGLARDRACASVALGDYDYDGLVDLYVVDPRGPNRLYHRERGDDGSAAGFRDYATSRVVGGEPDGRAALFTDVDQDGLLDIYLVNGHAAAGNAVFLARGYGWFARALAGSGGVGPRGHGAPAASDFDLDGRVDLFVAGGDEHPALWLGGDADTFADLSLVSGIGVADRVRSFAAADLDDDGDTDLFVPAAGGGGAGLWRNELGSGTGFLKVQLMATRSSTDAAGATVVVKSASGSQAQVMTNGSGHGAAQPLELVFGLGRESRAEVEVRWPGGMIESFGWVDAGTRVLLAQSVGRPDVLGALTFELGPRTGVEQDGR